MEVRLLKMLQIIVAHGPDRLEQLDRREEIASVLRHEGFWDFEVSRIFDWLDQLRDEPDYVAQIQELLDASTSGPPAIPVLSLSDRAHAFLTSVRDLGLIDEGMEEEILNQAMMQPGGAISFEEIRRIAARIIFDRQFRSGEEYYGIFEEEWKLLFN